MKRKAIDGGADSKADGKADAIAMGMTSLTNKTKTTHDDKKPRLSTPGSWKDGSVCNMGKGNAYVVVEASNIINDATPTPYKCKCEIRSDDDFLAIWEALDETQYLNEAGVSIDQKGPRELLLR